MFVNSVNNDELSYTIGFSDTARISKKTVFDPKPKAEVFNGCFSTRKGPERSDGDPAGPRI